MESALCLFSITFCNDTGNASYEIYNSTLSFFDEIEQFDMPFFFTIFIITLYGITFVCGIVGNLGVIYIIKYLKRPKKKTISDFFMSSIAMGDIALAFTAIPYTKISSFLFDSWPFGSATCALAEYLQWCFLLQKSFSIVAISCDRHVIIAMPLRSRISKRKAKLFVMLSTGLAFLFAMPTAITSQVIYVSVDGNSEALCTEIWRSSTLKMTYTIVLAMVHFILPLLIMTVSNTHVVYLIMSRKTPGEPDKARDTNIASTKKRSVKLIITMMIMFALTWLPLEVLTFIDENDGTIFSNKRIHILWLTFHWMTYTNCTSNPLLYCWVNRDFRKGFYYLLCKCTLCESTRRFVGRRNSPHSYYFSTLLTYELKRKNSK